MKKEDLIKGDIILVGDGDLSFGVKRMFSHVDDYGRVHTFGRFEGSETVGWDNFRFIARPSAAEYEDRDGKDTSSNNGGKTDYYQLESSPFQINDFDDFAEWRGLNGNQFNIGKVVWTFNVGRHSGTDYVRDLNKIIHYANRELLRISRS